MDKRLLDFSIIGSQRSGSSFLGGLLDAQPGIHVPRDEVPFFEPGNFSAARVVELPKVFDRSVGADDLRGIKCADYLGRAGSEANLHAAVGGIPLIAVLRHPRDRAVSAYNWYMSRGLLPPRPIDEGLDLLMSSEPQDRAFEVLDYGRYDRHLPRWWKHFGEGGVLLVRTEALRSSETAARLTSLLGRLVEPAADGSRRRANEGAYDLRRVRWLRHKRRFRSYVRGGRFDFDRRGAGRLVDAAITGFVKAADDVVLRRIWTNPDHPSSATLTRLDEYYSPTIDWLVEHLGGEFAGWADPGGSVER